LASIGCAMASQIEHLTFWRILQALGGAASIVIPRAVVRDNLNTRDSAKALSLLLLIMGVTPILGPIVGGQVLIFSVWRGIFIIIASVGLTFTSRPVSTMHETVPAQHVIPFGASNIALTSWSLLRQVRYTFYTLAAGFRTAGMFTFVSGAPRVISDSFNV